MNMKAAFSLFAVIFALSGFAWADSAVPVSPANVTTQACPTFSWSAVEGAGAYNIEIFEQQTPDMLPHHVISTAAAPVRTWEITAPALTVTPSSDQCLKSGVNYVWYVRGVDNAGQGQWSGGRLFQVDTAMSSEQKDAMYKVVKEFLSSREGRQLLIDLGNESRAAGPMVSYANGSELKKTVANQKNQTVVVSQSDGTGQPNVVPPATASFSVDANQLTVVGKVVQTIDNSGSVGYTTFLDNRSNGTGLVGEADNGSNAWGLNGRSTQGIGVFGISESMYGIKGQSTNSTGVYGYSTVMVGVSGTTTGSGGGSYGGQFINTSSTGKALGATVNSKEVMYVDADGIHAGPAMTGTPHAFASITRWGTFGSGVHTSNINTVTHAGVGEYHIFLSDDPSPSYSNYVVSITAMYPMFTVPLYDFVSGYIRVYLWDVVAGTYADGDFSIVVFRL